MPFRARLRNEDDNAVINDAVEHCRETGCLLGIRPSQGPRVSFVCLYVRVFFIPLNLAGPVR